MEDPKASAVPFFGLAVAVTYGSVAVGTNFVNKYAMMILPLPNLILLIKTVTILVVVKSLEVFSIITLPPVTTQKVQEMIPISVVYCLHAALVLRSLARLSVPMYNTLKRLTPIMVLIAKTVIDQKLPDGDTTASLLLSVAGCIIAAAGDLSFDGQGYIVALVCAALQATYMILAEAQTKAKGGSGGGKAVTQPASSAPLKGVSNGGSSNGHATGNNDSILLISEKHSAVGHRITAPSSGSQGGAMDVESASTVSAAEGGGSGKKGGKSSPFEILFYMGLVGTPLLLAATLYSGEQEIAGAMFSKQYHKLGPLTFSIWMLFIATVEGMLTGCMIWCAQVNSALTTSIVGVLKGVFAVLLGFFLLGGVKFSFVNVLGITITLIGGSWYSWIGYHKSQAKAAAAKAAAITAASEEKAPLLSAGKS